KPGTGQGDALRCPLPVRPLRLENLTSDLCNALEDAGCPLAPPVQERLRFETLLAELSARFVNLAASQVDPQIESALRRVVEFMGIDRGGRAEVLTDQKQLVMTHSDHVPGAPPDPHPILDEQLPWYTRTISQGEILRLSALSADLPPDAVKEREYCLR